jgi:hypothetical protein
MAQAQAFHCTEVDAGVHLNALRLTNGEPIDSGRSIMDFTYTIPYSPLGVQPVPWCFLLSPSECDGQEKGMRITAGVVNTLPKHIVMELQRR